MQMKYHPLAKTSQELRRSIARLQNFLVSPLPIPAEELKIAQELIADLERVYAKIPEDYRDTDLQRTK